MAKDRVVLHVGGNLLLAAGRGGNAQVLFVFLICIFVVVMVIGLITSSQSRKKRVAGLRQAAEQLGFEFFSKGNSDYQKSLADMPLMKLGHGKELSNLLRGNSQSISVNIFDYKYVTGGGRSSTIWRQSVIGFQAEALTLPDFTLSPKGMWSKLGTLFGKQSIEFDNHPEFNSKYLLRGSDVDAVRDLFTLPVLDFYEQNLGWSTEGTGNRLLLYKTSKRVPPPETAALLEDGLKVLSLMHSSSV
ncbi:MAG TPA: hypothetical protein VFE46_12045 [Pirellulales bacterium]|nr:hypothetical protein [Pirellulales bacterium]